VSPRPYDLCALGEPLIEFNQRDPAAPLYHRSFGGDTSNCVIAAARLGARCAYLTQVGDDSFGADLLRLWADERVATAGVRVVTGGMTGIYFVSHGPSGHEFTYRRAGSAAARITPSDVDAGIIAASRWLHVSGISLAISDSARDAVFAALRIAREGGTRVSLDLNFRPRLWSAAQALETIERALAYADLFFPSVDEVETLTGLTGESEIVAWAHARGAAAVALKLGARGAIVSQGSGLAHVPPYPVTPVDATGAGDCFAGACLSRLARGESLAEAAAFANVAAALSTQSFGAVDGLPTEEKVRSAQASRPVR